MPTSFSPNTRAALGLHALEAREVPPAFAFANGVLTVNLPEVASRSVFVDANTAGVVVINSRATGGPSNFVVGAPNGRLAADQVTSIVVNGSPQNDVVNLTGVDAARFRNLRGPVTVSGGDGRDILYGSGLNDSITGGRGDDRIFGGYGDDRIEGGADKDELYGDGNSGASNRFGGNDRLDGGDHDDYLEGGGGSDLLIGGAGADRLRDSGTTGRDVFWVDNLDVFFPGAAEVINRTGRPPRV